VGEPRPEVVTLVIDEHLGLILEPAKCGAVHDPIAIALERAAQPAGRLAVAPATTALGMARIRGPWRARVTRGAETAV
jgi:hypothetical protein